ncbi:MAG: DNA gyrase inhibitor YacG [Pirellulales bacterium]
MVRLPTCPICRKTFDPTKTPAMPFCSDRCRRIDLARWADEKYAVPLLRDEEPLDADFLDAEKPAGDDSDGD